MFTGLLGISIVQESRPLQNSLEEHVTRTKDFRAEGRDFVTPRIINFTGGGNSKDRWWGQEADSVVTVCDPLERLLDGG